MELKTIHLGTMIKRTQGTGQKRGVAGPNDQHGAYQYLQDF